MAFLSEESPDAIFVTTVYIAVVRKRKEAIMPKFKRVSKHIVYIPIRINCDRFQIEPGPDGYAHGLSCPARKEREECKTCRLNKWKNTKH